MTGAVTASRFGDRDDSVIHDIGYQRYTGPRLGRRYAVRSLYGYSLRSAFGLGRGAKAKIFPWSVAGLGVLVAAVLAAIRAQAGIVPVGYPRFPETIQMLTVLFLAVVAPELVSRDLRAGVLPLYFSRPLRRADYALVKLGALATATWLTLAVPMLLMFLAGAFGTGTGMRGVWHEANLLWPGLLYAAVTAVLLSSIALLIASLSGRRAVTAGAVVAAFLVTTPVMAVLYGVGGSTQRQLAALVNPLTLLQEIRRYAFGSTEATLDIGRFGPLYLAVAVALVLACVALLLARYRKVAR